MERESEASEEERGLRADEESALAERGLAAWEIATVVVSTIVGEWVVFSVGGGSNLLLAVPVLLIFGFAFCSHRLRGERARELGWRFDNFFEAMRLLLLPMMAASVALIAFGAWNGTLNFTRWRGGQSILGLPALGFLWGLMQQYVLQAFINRRAQIIWGRGVRSTLCVRKRRASPTCCSVRRRPPPLSWTA